MYSKHKSLAIVVALAVMLLGQAAVSAQENFTQFRVVGHYAYYNIYDDYFVTDIPVNRLTHVVYEHIDISSNGQCVSRDPYADVEYLYPGDRSTERVTGNFKQLAELRETNPDLQIIMSIGGWEASPNFVDVTATDDARIRFVRSCLNFMREYDFDGIMIDWQHPVSGGSVTGIPADTDNYNLLLADFRGQLDYWQGEDTANYTLAMTVPATPDLLINYDLAVAATIVDFISVRSFAFEGSWSEIAGHHAPLYVSDKDPRDLTVQTDYTVSGAIENILTAGVPSNRIVMGIGFFGQSWQGVRDNDIFGLYADNNGVPRNARDQGILYYNDLTNFFDSDNYVRYFDESARAPWLYNAGAGIAISYEDSESVRNKAAYVRQRDLGGVGVWDLSFDDSQHTLVNEVFTLLNN
ncbi:MAG: glycoside hydrolase family 18 protein [Chloroflexota bacterium]